MKLPETWFEETLALMKCSPEEIANLSRVGKAKKQIDEYTNFIRAIQLDAAQHGFEVGKKWAARLAIVYNQGIITEQARSLVSVTIKTNNTTFTEAEEWLK